MLVTSQVLKLMKENKMAQSFSDRQAKNALNNIPFLRLFVATCNLPFKTDRYFQYDMTEKIIEKLIYGFEQVHFQT